MSRCQEPDSKLTDSKAASDPIIAVLVSISIPSY